MQTQQITIETKKVGAGHYEITVTDEANNEVKSYIETDMCIIDALNDVDAIDENEEVEGTGFSKWSATQEIIRKAGF